MIESARDGTPIQSLLEGVETSMINMRVGSRLEVCLDIDFQAIKIENRTWSYVCGDIFTDVALWTRYATSQSLWPALLRMYDYDIFPGVMMEFAHIFDHVLKGLYRQWEREDGLGVVASEAVCTMERLSAYLTICLPKPSTSGDSSAQAYVYQGPEEETSQLIVQITACEILGRRV
jgi:hypothetical protein